MELVLKAIVGLLVARFGYSFGCFILKMIRLYMLPYFGLKKNLKKYGAWAVVTGATDGIGKATSHELAKRGLNLVLISRTKDKLDATAEEIKKSHKVEVKVISYDFSDPDHYEIISKELESLEIGLLVNNVGMSYDHPDFFLNYDAKYYDQLMHLNVTSVLKMTRIVLKGMVERKSGLLVHISSGGSLMPTPFLTVYTALKVFVNNFSESLHLEYNCKGIESQYVCPGMVGTKMSKVRPSGLLIPSPETYAKQMVNAIGLSRSMAGYWFHELFFGTICSLPGWLRDPQTIKQMDATRRKWEKKQQSKKAE